MTLSIPTKLTLHILINVGPEDFEVTIPIGSGVHVIEADGMHQLVHNDPVNQASFSQRDSLPSSHTADHGETAAAVYIKEKEKVPREGEKENDVIITLKVSVTLDRVSVQEEGREGIGE